MISKRIKRILRKHFGIDDAEAVVAEIKSSAAQHAGMTAESRALLGGLDGLFNGIDDSYREFEDRLQIAVRNLEISSSELNVSNLSLEQLSITTATMMDALGQGILFFNQQGICGPVFSKPCLNILEASPAGKQIGDVLRLDAAGCERFSSIIKLVFSPDATAMTFDELVALGPQHYSHSEGLRVALAYRPMRNMTGKLYGVLVIATDVTDRFVAQQKLELKEHELRNALLVAETQSHEMEQAVERLTESNAMLEQFAYVTSHDIQEPIRTIANFCSLIEHNDKGKMDATQQKYFGIILDNAKRLQTMVKDLLEYSRLSHAPRLPEEIDPNVLLRHAMDNLNFVAEENKAQVICEQLPRFSGHPMQILCLFQNLLGNAIKYQPKQGRPVIHIDVKDKGNSWQFCVRDNGIGIAREHFEKIFSPFTRLHTQKDYAGTGLGLSSCKKIVANHGGMIWLESELDHGSQFYFTVRK